MPLADTVPAAAVRGAPTRRFHDVFLFAVIFAALVAMHAPLLRLPYFWDEAGYFVPSTRDLLLNGDLIPRSTLNNIHPPLVPAWIALAWKVAGYAPATTRVAMLLIAAFGLVGLFRLARQMFGVPVAIASVVLTALYPVFFAQSSMAHLDLAAAGFTFWGLDAYLRERRWQIAIWFSLAVLAKETAIIAPGALFAWEVIAAWRRRKSAPPTSARRASQMWGTLLVPIVPLMAWIAYHYARTGWLLGNPEFVQYNVGATLSVSRFLLALVQRVWQLAGHMGMIVLTLAASIALHYRDRDGKRDKAATTALLVVIGAYVLALSLVGGAVLSRYLLPVTPLWILLCVAAIARGIREWKVVVALAAGVFVLALFINPPYRFAPEDNLAYVDYVRLHQSAAEVIGARYPHARALTAWPASDEVTRPWLGYVGQPLSVARIENFSLDQIIAAQHSTEPFDVAYVFSTKYEPPRGLLMRWSWWEDKQRRFFDYHRDLPPDAIAQMLGGKVVWQQSQGGQWAAIIYIERNQVAQLQQ